MLRNKSTLLLRTKLIVGAIMTVLACLAVVLILQGMVDTEAYRERMQRFAQEKIGREAIVRGDIYVRLLPTPTIYLSYVEMRETVGSKPGPTLAIDQVIVESTFASILSDAPEVSRIFLKNPVLEVAQDEEGQMKWGWLNPALIGRIGGQPIAFDVSSGMVLIRSASAAQDMAIRDVQIAGTIGGAMEASGSLSGYGHRLNFEVDVGSPGEGKEHQVAPVQFSFSSGETDRLQFEGSADWNAEKPTVNGTLTLSLANLLTWTKPVEAPSEGILEKITNTSVQPTKRLDVFPVSLSGTWEQIGAQATFKATNFKAADTEGSGSVAINWGQAIPQINVDAALSVLDYARWQPLLMDLFGDASSIGATGVASRYREGVIPADVSLSATMQASAIRFRAQEWQNANLKATVDHGVATINEFNALLPGDSSLALFGVISQTSIRGVRFEGSMEAKGKSLRALMASFDSVTLELPESEFGEFHIRSNLFMAGDQTRLSEAEVKISQLKLNGGLVAHYEDVPRLEADLRLDDINFDYFRDAWRKKREAMPEAERKAGDFFMRYQQNESFSWLNKLGFVVDFKVSVDGFTFLDRKGNSASFKLLIKPGEFGIYNAHLYYPDDAMEASFSVNVEGKQPVFNVLLNTNHLDLAYFMPVGESPAPAKKPDLAPGEEEARWSEELIDASWLEGLTGAFDFSIGKLTIGQYLFDSVKFRVQVADHVATIQGMTFSYWQGRCAVSGSLYGGKVPGLSVGFTLYNAEMKEILASLVGRNNISGKVSVSGTLATSGVNLLSWVSQADADVLFTGRGVRVEKFNVPAVVDAVAVSRTASDVLSNVNLVLFDGATDMSVDGNFNVKAGVARSPGIVLKSGSITGLLSGTLKLVPWTMDLTTLYKFPMMTDDNTPTLTMQFIGPVDAPKTQVDTASLEAYVSKRIVGVNTGR